MNRFFSASDYTMVRTLFIFNSQEERQNLIKTQNHKIHIHNITEHTKKYQQELKRNY